ncbi:MAG TPA: LysM domain-containing protein, partial [Oscillospiraceae bacterium]|nr:LysM domain-containing protein [Oscillospiraceae bacterium]
RARYARSSRNKQIIFYVVLIAIIILSIFALIKLLGGGGEDPKNTETQTTLPVQSTEAPPVIVPPVDPDPTDEPTDPTEDPTETPPQPADSTYVVQAGDSPWGIMMESYGSYTDELYAAFMEYNGKAVGDNIFTGEELLVPPQSVLDAMIGD